MAESHSPAFNHHSLRFLSIWVSEYQLLEFFSFFAALLHLVQWSVRGYVGIHPPSSSSLLKGHLQAFGMTEIMVSDVNLNSVCERLEQHCCVDQNQHNLSSQPQTPVLKRHTNTGAKLWGRVRSKLLRQKVSSWHMHTHTSHTHASCFLSFIICALLFITVTSICLFCLSFMLSVPLHVCSLCLSPGVFLSAHSWPLFLSDGSIDCNRNTDVVLDKKVAKSVTWYDTSHRKTQKF